MQLASPTSSRVYAAASCRHPSPGLVFLFVVLAQERQQNQPGDESSDVRDERHAASADLRRKGVDDVGDEEEEDDEPRREVEEQAPEEPQERDRSEDGDDRHRIADGVRRQHARDGARRAEHR